jgi:hypothetical protein
MRRLAAIVIVLPTITLQQRAVEGAFVVRLGTDTVAVERFTLRGGQLEGTFVTRAPKTRLQQYSAKLAPDGTVRRFELGTYWGDWISGEPVERVRIDFGVETATVETTIGDSSDVRKVVASAGTTPVVLNSYALLELVTRRHRPTIGAIEPLGLFVGGASTVLIRLEPGPGDSLVATLGTIGPLRIALDSTGRILGVNGIGGVLNVQAERVATLDVRALAREWAARDAAGRGLGVLSPTDTVRAGVAGAAITVRYGRPSTRGRQIFGGVVPWNRVWRTGANEATHLSTEGDLVFEETRVAAGTYTLWTIPSPRGWTLILNGRTGQAALPYDEAHDVARIPMKVEQTAEFTERFTIAVEPDEMGGRLTMAWERTRASVAFRMRGAQD